MNNSSRSTQNRGFTLLEILLVVAAIGILASIVIVAINPSKQLAETRNAQRRADVNTILSAVYQYAIDNEGRLPFTSTGTLTEVCATGANSCSGLVDLSTLTDAETYLISVPVDPQGGVVLSGAGYSIATTSSGRVVVHAPKAEQGQTIEARR
jgi:prepilin-type N-terminal cleavage/methylation domain-containing protein